MQLSAERQRGFGLLEAIVALVILGTSGLMVFTWINQNLQTATRVKDAEAQAQLQLEAQSWLASLNPALAPGGEKAVGSLRLSWRSELLEPMRDEFDQWGHLAPRWQLGLYRIHVQAMRVDSGQQVEWRQIAAGWKLKSGFAAPADESRSP